MGLIHSHIALAEELSRYARLCYDRHLVGAAGGNLSVRIPETNYIFVTASGVALRDVNPGNILVLDLQGNVIEASDGPGPSKETGFHLAIYQAKPDVQAVIHVHPTHATVFAVQGKLIPRITISAEIKLKQGSLVPEADPGSQELACLVGKAVESSSPDSTILLLRRHGMVAFGSTLCAAFNDAELAEDTARIAWLTSAASNGSEKTRIIDLTAPLNERIQCYPTDPPFRRVWHVDYKDAGVYVSRIEMGAHAGTHVDAPLHFLGEGHDVSTMPLNSFFGWAVALDCPKGPGENIAPADLEKAEIQPDDIVLFRTGWEERACSPRFFEDEWPGFEPELIDELVERGVKAIGGDIASADSPRAIAAGAPAHKKAARANLPIFEALVNMRPLTGRRFTFIGLPLRLEGCEASPIRAIALLTP